MDATKNSQRRGEPGRPVLLGAALFVAASGAPAACSSKHAPDAGGGGDVLSSSDSAGTITVSSTAFAAGQPIPATFTCAGPDTSPEVSWTAGPSATLSYALVLTDLGNSYVHWVVWDLSPSTLALPASLSSDPMPASLAGGKQVHLALGGPGNGYVGPCPSGALHDYQFEVHALDVALLSGVTTASTSDEVKAQVLAHSIAHGDLIGSSDATKPADAAVQ
jgi:Raf kinase inhibitor-like YbhB/YbcL family protein